MFAAPLKRSDKLSFAGPLRKHITSTYKADPTPYDADLAALDALRESNISQANVDNSLQCARSLLLCAFFADPFHL